MATINAGRVRLVFKGAFQEGQEYKELDVVTNEGSSYVVVKDISTALSSFAILSNPIYAKLLASKGANGLPFRPTKVGLIADRPTTAIDGDSYLATDEGKIYFWSNGSWGIGILFGRGEKGEKGDKGDTGVAGKDGIEKIASFQLKNITDDYTLTNEDFTKGVILRVTTSTKTITISLPKLTDMNTLVGNMCIVRIVDLKENTLVKLQPTTTAKLLPSHITTLPRVGDTLALLVVSDGEYEAYGEIV